MYLTDEEKKMLQGEMGYVTQRCMEYLVEEGEVAGAERLVDIDGTCDFHLPHTAMVRHYYMSAEEIWKEVEKGSKFKVPTFGNKITAPCYFPDNWENCGVEPYNTKEHHDMAYSAEFLDAYIKMGLIPIYSCSYYTSSSYWPTAGQHCAWNESSAIPWCNAILGARTNIDGCFQTAFIGKVAEYDMHLDSKRVATMLVKSEKPLKNDMEYDLFGWATGEACNIRVPALVNIGSPTTTQLMKMNAALNTGGEVRMYHIPGVTPEASTLEHAFKGQKPQDEVLITRSELRRCYDLLNYYKHDDVEFVSLGCPHYNIIDIQKITRMLDGKKLKVPLWVMTNHVLYQLANELGYKDVIEKAGGALLSGSCPGISIKFPNNAKSIAVDAAKQSFYISGAYPNDDLDVFYGTTEDCINAAITGKWHGEFNI